MSGSVTFCSPDGEPLGAVLTSQISDTTPSAPVTLVPSFFRVAAIAEGTPDGGAPADSALYWAIAAAAASTPQTTTLERRAGFIVNLLDAHGNSLIPTRCVCP